MTEDRLEKLIGICKLAFKRCEEKLTEKCEYSPELSAMENFRLSEQLRADALEEMEHHRSQIEELEAVKERDPKE